ncbi:HAMP domain-containing sensor histidine kinase [Actinopolymorpha sp. NPDC004070]|uniref:sensor histidine kinase n=1 Tax=Actinopolymorpha sp. NPDC004070 TaxID=3154548 RepID=UPI0033B0B83A
MAVSTGGYSPHQSVRVPRAARIRVLGWLVALCAVVMAAAGGAVMAIEHDRTTTEVDAELIRDVRQLANTASIRLDPGSGQVAVPDRRDFSVAFAAHPPRPDEAYFGFVDGRLLARSAGSDLSGRAAFGPALSAARAFDGPVSGGVAAANDLRLYSTALPGTGDHHATLVVARDTSRLEAGLYAEFRTYALIASGGLVLLALVGFAATGRTLSRLRLPVRPTTGQPLTFAPLTLHRQVLDDAGHELRTPITIMRGHLELLNPNDRAEVAATRDLVLDELDRMARLVDDLATLATADRPDFLRPAPVNVGVLVKEIAEKARTLGHRDWVVEASTDATVVADAQRLTQALLQLADNAVRHTAEGDTIALGSGVDESIRMARLWVRDTGPGVSEADQERIFGRFERAAEEEPGSGSGLGLAIVAAIAKAHDGRVVLYSTPGAGSTFTVLIPLVGSGTEQARHRSVEREPALTGDADSEPAAGHVRVVR